MSEHVNNGQELWTPGQPFEIPFEQPTPEEFRLRFAQEVWGGRGEPGTVNLDGSLSALRWPERTPVAIALLDMDDLVGNLGGSLRQLQHGIGEQEFFAHDYGYDMFFDNEDKDIKYPLIRLVKNHEQPGIGMQPVKEIDDIASMVRSWRSAGVYTVFVTSAIEGAENSHVDFLAEHFPGACDGIVITSGDYRLVDKGKAAAEIVDFTGVEPGTSVVHLDDIGHNTRRVRAALQSHPLGLRVATFQHIFPHDSHLGPDEGSSHGATPLETFILANDFLTEQLGRTLHFPLAQLMPELRHPLAQPDGRTSVSLSRRL